MKVGYGVRAWKVIRKNWHVAASKISFVVGSERSVLFRKDRWCGPTTLCVAYPTLYTIATSKHALFINAWTLVG